MRLTTPLIILSRLINAFNYKEMKVENTINNYIKHDYWDQECLEHPTNNSCLIYCD